MWPFPRRPRFQLPAWTFRPVDEDRIPLRLSPGRWLVTDGAHLQHHVEVGRIAEPIASIDVQRNADGLRSLTLHYTPVFSLAKPPEEIVIDSGDVVFCCEEAFIESKITRRTSGVLLRAARNACPGVDTVLIQDGRGDCTGLIATPPWGDGTYRLVFSTGDELECVRIDLDESC